LVDVFDLLALLRPLLLLPLEAKLLLMAMLSAFFIFESDSLELNLELCELLVNVSKEEAIWARTCLTSAVEARKHGEIRIAMFNLKNEHDQFIKVTFRICRKKYK
jgi:hypothetical protein